MKFLKHLVENPFITFTGLAALVHSTWSLGTLFSGVAPSGYLAWIGWVIPAFFIAFAMDIGQISTSAKIRHQGLTWGRAAAFFTFSIATYYLQFLYIAHHMPALDIAAGISEFHLATVTIARDAAIWTLPTLLPLSTLLYTFSDDNSDKNSAEEMHSETDISIVNISDELEQKPELPELLAVNSANEEKESADFLHFEDIGDATNLLWCPDCGYETGVKDSMVAAQRALRAHQSRHCKVTPEIFQETVEVDNDVQE